VPGLDPGRTLDSLADIVTNDQPDLTLPPDDGLIGDELG
jgi:hypothetical protein